MDLAIKGHDVHVGDALRELVTKKTARLERFLPRWAVVEGRVDLHDRPARGAPAKTVELTITARGAVLRAEATAPDFAAALDEAADRMVRRMVRYRARWHDHRRGVPGEPALPALPDEATALAAEVEADATPAIVRSKRFSVRPMAADEALEQMELLGHDFFVFVNADTQQTNVVYRRRSGGHGLLEPDLA